MSLTHSLRPIGIADGRTFEIATSQIATFEIATSQIATGASGRTHATPRTKAV